MSKWEMVRLGDVCHINMGQSPDSSTYNQDEVGIPFYQGNADFGELNPVTRYWCSIPTKTANKDDILFSVRAPIGAINIAVEKCCIGRGLAALTAYKEVCNLNYLRNALYAKCDSIIEQGTGSTFKAINKAILTETEIPLPPLAEQQKIAAELDKISGLIAKRKSQIEKLDLLVKAKFVEMFGDPLTNLKEWETKILSDIAQSRLGKMLDAKQQSGKQQYKYLANFNVQWFRFNLSELNQMDFSDKDRLEFCLQKGDVLICEGGEVGRCAVWNEPIKNCFFQKALHRVRCNEQMVNPYYLAWFFYFKANHNRFADVIGSQATISHLTGEKLKKILILLPPVLLQNQFADFVQKTELTKTTMQKSLAGLETLYKARMQEYFE